MKRAVWALATTFVMIGVGFALLRAAFVDDLVSRAEPVRTSAFEALGIVDPASAARRAELLQIVDSRYAENREMTYAHVLLGAVYLVFGLLQFSGTLRRRYVAYHRWAGRVLLVLAVVMVGAGMYFGLLMPFAGWGERFVIAVVGGLFLFALARGYLAIRARDRETHRAWMMRAFALALGVTTVRLAAAVLDPVMTPMGVAPATLFVLTLWIGWGTTLIATEWWLAHTRRAM
jgi:hypothetical protein